MIIEQLKQKYLDNGFPEMWAEAKARHDFEKQVAKIPFTMPEQVPVGYDMGPLD